MTLLYLAVGVFVSKGNHAQKVEPIPRTEVNPIFPPAASTVAREIVKSNPIPCVNSFNFSNQVNTLS